MAKKDKNPKNNKNDKGPDLVDFLFDNSGTFRKGFVDLMGYARDVWDVLPEIVAKIFYGMFDVLQKVMLRLRSHFALMLTQDMKHLDIDRQLWEYLKSLHAQERLVRTIKRGRKKGINQKQKDYYELLGYYVRKDKKDNFLSCCITQQNNKDFIEVRNKLIGKMKGGAYLVTESEAETSKNMMTEDEVYSRDIFTQSEKQKNKVHKKQTIHKTGTDFTRSVRIVSVIENFDKKKTDSDNKFDEE